MRRSSTLIALSLVLAATWIVAGHADPAGAEILVLKDGSQVEIDGPWRSRGRLVEFTLKDGTLGSVRASEVDTDASRQATEAAQRAAAEAAAADEQSEKEAEEPPEPVYVWTDKDIPRASAAVLMGAEAALQAEQIRVMDWNVDRDDDRQYVFRVTGTVQNFGNDPLIGIGVSVTVTGDRPEGEDPELIRKARIDQSDLGPGEQATFTLEVDRSDIVAVGSEPEFKNPDVDFIVTFDAPEPAATSDSDTDSSGG